MPLKDKVKYSVIDTNRDGKFNNEITEITVQSTNPIELMSSRRKVEPVNLQTEWERADPHIALLLSETFDAADAAAERNSIKSSCKSVELFVLPFHHLLPAKLLADNSKFPIPERGCTGSSIRHRRQLFWQLLASAGITAREASLLDDSLTCHFRQGSNDKREINDRQSVKVDWEVNYHDDLQGCAEIYRAELLFWKRLIYEAGDNLREIIEFPSEVLTTFLNAEIFSRLGIKDTNHLFLNNLTGSFELTVSGEEDLSLDNTLIKKETGNKIKRQLRRRMITETSLRPYFQTCISKRIESWLGTRHEADSGKWQSADNAIDKPIDPKRKPELPRVQGDEPASRNMVYRVRLNDYWLKWQRAARITVFDFDYLETVADARALRFYELTKLWRVSLLKINSSGGKPGAKVKARARNAEIPKSMEICYGKLAALLPLPALNHERDIKGLISQITKTFISNGYLKSFAVKPGWNEIEGCNTRIIFRFND